MNQKTIKAAQRERERRAEAWAQKVSDYLAAGGPNTPQILAIFEEARRRRELKST